jgi:apolipoprotein N-acyltransferase
VNPGAPRPLALLVPTLVSAVLYGLAFPPLGWRWLAWVALVPFLLAVRRAGRGAALLLAWAWLITMALAVGDALPRAVATYYEQSTLFGIGFAVAVFSLHGVPYYMAFALWYRAMRDVSAVVLPLLVGAAWVALELGRVKFLTGNPWALAGYSQVSTGTLVQIADVTGVYGTSFVLVAVNAALAEGWLAQRGRRPRGPALAGLGLAALAAAAVAGYGVIRLHGAPPPAEPGGVEVAVVQGNLDVGSQWRPQFYGRNLDVYLRLTDRALRDGRPALVFWPESAMTFFLEEEPPYRAVIARVLSPGGAQLLAGGPRVMRLPEPRYFNAAFLLSPAGEVVARYDKEHLLPFAEYFPLARLDFLRRRFVRARVFTPGDPTLPLPTVAGPAGVVICNEGLFPEIVRARVRAGAGYLVSLANDSWLGDRKYALRVFDITALRAVEQRRFLVRASTSGPSAIIDPWGRVLARTEPYTQDTIRGRIRASTATTVYGRVGDLFAGLCTIATAGALGVRRRRLSPPR